MNKIITILISILTFLYSCTPLEHFYASDCQRNNCKYGFSGLHYDGDILTVDYGTSSNCKTSFEGDVVCRNDSLILIAEYVNLGASCICGFSLTYLIKVEDTCDLKIGFEMIESERYLKFEERWQKKQKRLDRVSENRSEIVEMKMMIKYSSYFGMDEQYIKDYKSEIRDIRKYNRESRKKNLIEKERARQFENYTNPNKKNTIRDDVYY